MGGVGGGNKHVAPKDLGNGLLEVLETSTSSSIRVIDVRKGEILAVVEVSRDERWVKVKSVAGTSGYIKLDNTKVYESPPPSEVSEPPPSQ